ncbi:MAG: sensor histidine kinase [Limisphaerales bacterium]|nr:MAG: sensor histidine kinase [Limisphaerales bacterium]KAG0507676.1 MAG: sensor histidine kinase [Limisphaerales bacterium]TXT51795.1 MAG: sensor histidine kinase [Limisphaerales bacterium]
MNPSSPAVPVAPPERNRRVLIVDDDPQVHIIMQRVLTMPPPVARGAAVINIAPFQPESASGGEEAERLARAAEDSGQPFAMAFVDMYMPGLDGEATLSRLWHVSPELQVVLCTGAADTALARLLERFGHTDQLIILKKPFELLEILQLANAMTAKWQHFIESQGHLANLEQAVFERTEDARKALAKVQWELDERRKSEAQLRRNEELLRLITDNAADLIAVVDAAGNRLYNSPSYERVLGYTPAELGRTKSLAQVHPEDRPRIERARRAASQEGHGINLEYRMQHKDGSWRTLESSGAAIRNERGEVEKFVLVARDITARKQVEAAAHESGERLRSLIANIPGAVYRCTPPPERRIEFISELIWDLSGYASADFLDDRTHGFASITHPDDFPRVQAAIQEGLARRLPYVADYRVVRWDGTLRWVHEKGQAAFDADGRVRWLDGVIFDITERKQQEEEMRRLHRETEKLFASISAVLIGVDVEGRVARWNEAAAQTFGLAAEAVMHQSFHSLPIGWDWEKLLTVISHAVHLERHLELDNFRVARASGRDAFLNLSVTPSKPDVENRLNYILLAVDVTHRRELEAQLRQAQKLESIGQLAAGIAHEINTPTQYIGDNLRFLQDAFRDLGSLLDAHGRLLAAAKNGGPTPEIIAVAEQAVQTADVDYLQGEIPRAIGESLAGVERVSTIVRAMKEFSHPGAEEKTPVDLNRAIESTITVARNEWKYVAELETDFDAALPPVPCLPGEFNQVVLNLIVNAAHAIAAKIGDGSGGKGLITVRTRKDGDWADIRIRDSGMGIPEPARDKIFEPFFTTKEVGKGTGQGLAIARSVVVDKHGGTITFETETGQGTTFIVRLPLAPGAGEAKRA